MSNYGVDAGGLLAAKDALSGGSDDYGNDSRVEHLWAMKAMDHAEVYFNLLCSVDPARLKLTGSLQSDDTIYKTFREKFPNLNVGKLKEDDLKSEKAKVEWREFSEGFKESVEDYSLGSLLRLDSACDYTEENSIIAIKIQFFAIEIARNREGHNESIRSNFKPKARQPRPAEPAHDKTGGGVLAEIEHELRQVIGGNHQLQQ